MNKLEQRQTILDIVSKWAGSTATAEKWFDEELILALGCTPKEAVEKGEFDALKSYLEIISMGGYA